MAFHANFRCSKPTFHLKINHQRTSPQNLSFPLFSRDLAKSTPVRFPVIRASSSSSPSNPKPSLLKTTCITLAAAAALFSASFHLTPKLTMVPVAIYAEEATLEKHLETHSNDVEALLSLTKIKFESSKYGQAIEILNRMIEIEPDEQHWPAMKARILSYYSESKSAIKAFEEILLKDPLRVDAYHYLVMEYYNSKPKLTELEKRINEAIRRCQKEKKTKEIRDLKVLIAQIRVIEGNSEEAIRICEEIVKEDPKDFRIYLFQGLVYVLMKKEDEAGKQFEELARLLPVDHPSIIRVNGTTNMDMNMMNVSRWRSMVAYDNIFCYLSTFSKLFLPSLFGKFG